METSGTKQILLFIQDDWKLLLFLTSLFLLYSYFTSTFDHFEKKGVPYMKPVIFFGNLWPRIITKSSYHEFQMKVYKHFKGNPFGGMFEGRRPTLYIFDPELIKAVTIRDFDHFVNRNQLNTNEPRYLKRTIINLKGSEWKGVRSAITPAFSSARLKNMLPIADACSQQLTDYMAKYDNKDVNLKEVMGHYTLEVIGAWAFGIKCDALNDENTNFVKVAEKFNHMPALKRCVILFMLVFMPFMFKYLNISFLYLKSTDELVKILKAAKDERRSSAIKKNDFLQNLIEAAEKEKNDPTNSKTFIDDDTIDGQSLIFLVAGYETTSTLLSFAIYTLATKPELQEKLRQYIQEETQNRDLDYDLLAQLTYLEAFLLETLRIYPPLARLDRACSKAYTFPGTDVSVNIGDIISFPVYALHMDPDFYPDPTEFRPERFMGDEKKDRPAHLYLAFGVGPRNCIGKRFALISAKLAMVALLKKYKFSVCDKTQVPVQFDKRSILLKPRNGLWVRVEALNTKKE